MMITAVFASHPERPTTESKDYRSCFGPTYKNRIRHADLSLSAFGILRSAEAFHWDADNIGHKLSGELRFGTRRGFFAFGATSFDVVAPIEPWQLTEPDAGLAAFFSDATTSITSGVTVRVRMCLRSPPAERPSPPASAMSAGAREIARSVFTLFHDDDGWRANPRIDDGRVHVADVEFDLDTRTSEINPWAGWLIKANYEHGIGDFWINESEFTFLQEHRSYGRAFFDIRRYNRISPKRQINARLVFGGWLGGDELPLERRFSVGGIGTIPGFDFRREGIGTDVGQCTDPNFPSSGGAQCERVALAQLEYRHELLSELFDVFNRNGIRVRGAVFRVKPTAVAFVDAGQRLACRPARRHAPVSVRLPSRLRHVQDGRGRRSRSRFDWRLRRQGRFIVERTCELLRAHPRPLLGRWQACAGSHVLSLLAVFANGAAAQKAQVMLIMPEPAMLATEPPSVRSSSLITDGAMLDLVRNGFPAHLHYKLERWSTGGFFDDVTALAEWDAVVRYDALAKVFQVYRAVGKKTTFLGSFPTSLAAESVLDVPFPLQFNRPRKERRATTISCSISRLSHSPSSTKWNSGCAASSSPLFAERKIRAPLLVAASGL